MSDQIERQTIEERLPSNDLSDVMEGSLAVGLARAEIDTQIATARRFPRQISQVSQRILSLATLDEETAEESMYALPRGGKPIQGPSIRFAEIVKTSYGNCRAAARVVHVDRLEKVVIAEGVFHDLETNTATRAEVRRRIVTSRGALYNDDMIIVTGNAACSIALRNAILGGVPKGLWRKAYDAVLGTIAGDVKTLAVTRDRAIKALANFGVKPEQVFVALGVGGEEDITVSHIPTLRGMFATLKNGEATVEEMFSSTVAKAGHEKIANPLRDEPPHDAKTGEMTEQQKPAGDARRTEDDAPFDGGHRVQGSAASTATGDRITSGPALQEAARAEAGKGQDADRLQESQSSAAKPAKAPAPPSNAIPEFESGDAYVEWFTDQLDKAKNPTAVRDEWGRTREIRREILSDEELTSVEAKKNAAIERLKA